MGKPTLYAFIRGGFGVNAEQLCADVDVQVRAQLATAGYALVEVAYENEGGSDVLRLLVDKEGGVDLDDCERVTDMVSALLDAHAHLQHAYILEVSSPGAERPLRTADEYMQAIGQYVYVETRHPLNGQSAWEGWLDQYEEETVLLRLQKGKKSLRIPREDITFARRSVYFG